MSRKTSTPLLALFALGVVFGDIGTSPIYAFQQSVSDGQSTVDGIYGVASLIFWALTIVVSIKYLLFVLRADNKGEGGVLALFSLQPTSIRQPTRRRHYAVFLALLLGTAFLFGDGFITPAISVLSAVEGTGIINPSWVHFEVPITCAILIALFAVQYKGTAKIGAIFGPIMLLWFGTLAVLGIREISTHPSVLRALSPTYAVSFLAHNGWHSFIVLSSVILAITGVEALYADLGHFGATAIRLAWLLVAFPALILNYLGQAAEEISSPHNANALFFNMAPNHGWLIYLVVLSTVATVIASQALIAGVGSISRQAVQMGLFPRLQIIHTSSREAGQIYVPFMNTLLGVGTILLVVIFQSSSNLANAYSFDISGTMLITTVGLGIVASYRWHWKRSAVLALCVPLGLLDVAFFSSTATKIFKGAWVPLALALVILAVMLVWRYGNSVLTRQLRAAAVSWDQLDTLLDTNKVFMAPRTGIFPTSSLERVPQAALSQIRQMHVLPQRVVAVMVTTSDEAYEEKLEAVTEISDTVTAVSFVMGYMNEVNLPDLVRRYVMSAEDEADATYYLADRKFNNMNTGEVTGLIESVFTFMHRNSATPSHYFALPDERIVTLGTQLDL